MIELTPDQKLFIVQHLATYHSIAQVKKLLLETYSVDVTPQVISAYNPATIAGARIGQDLKDAFAAARRAFQEDAADIAITNKNYRRRKLQELLDDPKVGRSPKVVTEVIRLYEQIEGGMFSKQKQEDTGAAGLELLRAALGVMLPGGQDAAAAGATAAGESDGDRAGA